MTGRYRPGQETVPPPPARPAVEFFRLFRCSYIPGYTPAQPPRPVCRRSTRCDGCPYPGHGFLCWGIGEDCMRTRMEEINSRRKEKR